MTPANRLAPVVSLAAYRHRRELRLHGAYRRAPEPSRCCNPRCRAELHMDKRVCIVTDQSGASAIYCSDCGWSLMGAEEVL